MTVIGFDFGLKRIGVAIGNTITGIATPNCTLESHNQQPDWEKISTLINEWRPDKLIVGMPYHLDRTENEMTEAAQRFANRLQGRYQLPVETVTEQLSSREAEQRLKQTRQQGRKQKIKKTEIDRLAAAIILESWMQEHGL